MLLDNETAVQSSAHLLEAIGWPWSRGMIAVAVVSGYIATSYFFLKFPFWKKKRQAFRCLHISHRGGAGENLENTMTAFRHAATTGTHMLELDVHLSKDGEVIVAHDAIFLRTAGREGTIAETNYFDLPLLKEQLVVDFGTRHTVTGKDNDRKMPLLRQVFEEFPTLPVSVDLKQKSDVLVHKTSELIKEFKREHLTVWGNFHHIMIEKCYRENSNIPIFFSIRRVLITVLAFWTGFLPFMPIKEQVFSVPMPSIFLGGDKNFAVGKFSNRIVFWVMDKIMMRKALFDHLKKRGVTVFLWVLNNEAEFDRAIALGANGIMTDFPTALRTYLDKHPELSMTKDEK
ncbi:hypothetical protein RvY_15595-2 [Ramazzottius varieornatus]|uniref:GP-PDE domain-containing protein n=1 Tax=Ramazzottius varieornatus TaxID=947166 RepID=A0A1D1W283_RAMVA|nr:hypothetical protein RvY_15595-2 [Ramazzottius varieornatus]